MNLELLSVEGGRLFGAALVFGIFFTVLAVVVWLARNSRRWCVPVILWAQAVVMVLFAVVSVLNARGVTIWQLLRTQSKHQAPSEQYSASNRIVAPQPQSFRPRSMQRLLPAMQATQSVSFPRMFSWSYALSPNDQAHRQPPTATVERKGDSR
jgi:hypothetical protein